MVAKAIVSLEITVRLQAAGYVVEIAGELGIASVDQFELYLNRLAAVRPQLVVFDLAGLTMISSLALGMLLRLTRGLRRVGGHVELRNLQPSVREALVRTGLDAYFGL